MFSSTGIEQLMKHNKNECTRSYWMEFASSWLFLLLEA